MKVQKIQRIYYRLELTESELDTLLESLFNNNETQKIIDLRSVLNEQVNLCNKYELNYPTSKEKF